MSRLNPIISSLVALALMTTTALSSEISGAGSSFVYPLLSKVSVDYEKATGNKVNYQSIGSGAGVKQIEAGTIDFAATDKPVSPEDLAKFQLKQIPLVSGGIVFITNIGSPVVLTDAVIVSIFTGQITQWNDETIQILNPNIKLPNIPIVVVHRSDGSGTTYNLTKHFEDVSAKFGPGVPTWDLGVDSVIEWPVGLGAKGNEGIAGTVSNTTGAIGYVEYSYAEQNNLTVATTFVDGNKIVPNLDTFSNGTWPIMATTYMVYPVSVKPEVVDFVKWFYTQTDTAKSLDYVPLTNIPQEF